MLKSGVAHRALALPDILRPTFSFVLLGLLGPTAQSNYAYRLAQVSRSFFEAAIGFVWEDVNIETIFYLIPLVRELLWARGVQRSRHECKADLENFDPATWTENQMSRLHFYGKFIKKLSLRANDGPHTLQDDQLMYMLESPLGRSVMRYLELHPILLGLEVLEVNLSKVKLSLDWKLALVPQNYSILKLIVIGMALEWPSKREDERALISRAINRFPRLQSFELHLITMRYGPMSTNEELAFPQLPISDSPLDLQVTSVRVNSDTLDWASRLPSLQHLVIPRAHGPLAYESAKPTRLYLFDTLTVLHIGWDRRVVSLLENCRFPNLIEICLDIHGKLSGRFNGPELHSLASAISQHGPKIKILDIRSYPCRDDELAQFLGKFQTLELSTLRLRIGLRTGTIKFLDLNEIIVGYWPRLTHLTWGLPLSLQEVAEVIACYPHLTSFTFSTMCGPWVKPVGVAPLASVAPLSLNCHFKFVDHQLMNAEEVSGWLRDIRSGVQYEIYTKY